jgi:hypothetical protein
LRLAEIIGRSDLIVTVNGQKYERTDASTLLSPPPENQDDTLPWTYLGHRLGIEPDRVPRPASKQGGHSMSVADIARALRDARREDKHWRRCSLHNGSVLVGPRGQMPGSCGAPASTSRAKTPTMGPKKHPNRSCEQAPDAVAGGHQGPP